MLLKYPFPAGDSAYPQPVSQPLKLSAPKKVNWLPAKTGGVKSVIKELDIDALPATPFDTAGFKTFSKIPEAVHFDFNALPDTVLNLEKVPSKSFHFKSTVLAPPVVEKAGFVVPKKGTNISISDVGLAQGLPDKIIICIIQDKNGFIWIGTDKALYRYDGESMVSYLSVSRGIFDIIEDAEGRIWYINPERIGMIDLNKGVVSTSTEIQTQFPQLPKMILDESGNIWISRISSKGIAIIDPRNLTYKKLDGSNGLSGPFGAWGIFEDKKKNIWLSSGGGINIINPERNKIRYLKK